MTGNKFGIIRFYLLATGFILFTWLEVSGIKYALQFRLCVLSLAAIGDALSELFNSVFISADFELNAGVEPMEHYLLSYKAAIFPRQKLILLL